MYTRYAHQDRCVAIAREEDSFAFFCETGTGKTLIAIDIIKEKLHEMQRGCALVVCPMAIIEPAWVEDIAKFAPHLKVAPLWAPTAAGRRALLARSLDADVFVVNFEGFKVLYSDLRDVVQPDILIVDESSKMKSPKSQITRALLMFSQNVRHRYILSGTPAPNSELEYFCQMKLVDPRLFGASFYSFRNSWFYQHGYGGFKWLLKEQYRDQFTERIARKAIFISKDDCLDLPKKTFAVRKVYPTKQQVAAYKSMMKDLIAELLDENGNLTEIAVRSCLAKVMKLRQITSGFMYDENGHTVTFSKQKINALTELLEEIGPRRVIIWCQFQHDMAQIKALLGDRAALFSGMVSKEEKDQAIKDFREGRIQYLIAHPKTGQYGLTLVEAAHCVYYSISYSLEEFLQSQDRIHRIGQAQNVTYYMLLMDGTIDETMYGILDNKEEASRALLDMLKREE